MADLYLRESALKIDAQNLPAHAATNHPVSDHRNDAVNSDFSGSILSTVFSCSPEASLEIYEEKLKPSIGSIRKTDISLDVLVRDSEKIVRQTFAYDPRSIYAYTTDEEEISVKLDEIMLAMLECSEECGGESDYATWHPQF